MKDSSEDERRHIEQERKEKRKRVVEQLIVSAGKPNERSAPAETVHIGRKVIEPVEKGL